MVQSRHARPSCVGLLCTWGALAAIPMQGAIAASVGGEVSVTSDYIYRGLSESAGHAAVQVDLHASSAAGTFVGAWGSTRDHKLDPQGDYEVQLYLGHRLNLTSAWSTTLTAISYSYMGDSDAISDDFQEASASVSYLDRWTFSLSATPNFVHYRSYHRLGRTPAYIADTAGQWLLSEGLFLTGGAGYYYYFLRNSAPGRAVGAGYGYGNVGFAFERQGWRLDVGYFFTQRRAGLLSAYPSADNRVAGSLSWHF